jgi:hypothetical protein
MGVRQPLAGVSNGVTSGINASRPVDATIATAIRIQLHPGSSRIPHKKYRGEAPVQQREQ